MVKKQIELWKNGFVIGAAVALLPIWEAHYNIAVAVIVTALFVIGNNINELIEEERRNDLGSD